MDTLRVLNCYSATKNPSPLETQSAREFRFLHHHNRQRTFRVVGFLNPQSTPHYLESITTTIFSHRLCRVYPNQGRRERGNTNEVKDSRRVIRDLVVESMNDVDCL